MKIANYILLFESSLKIFEFLHNIMDDILLRIIFSFPSPRIFVIVGHIISVWKKCDGFWIYICICTYIPNHKTVLAKLDSLTAVYITCYIIRNYYYYYYYYFGVRCARPGESEDTLSVQKLQPHTTNPWRKKKIKQ